MLDVPKTTIALEPVPLVWYLQYFPGGLHPSIVLEALQKVFCAALRIVWKVLSAWLFTSFLIYAMISSTEDSQSQVYVGNQALSILSIYKYSYAVS